MARKPRSQRTRSSYSASGATQVLDPEDDTAVAGVAPAAAPRPRPRPTAHIAPSARVVDYTYVIHDVIRIGIITLVLIAGMVGLSMVMG